MAKTVDIKVRGWHVDATACLEASDCNREHITDIGALYAAFVRSYDKTFVTPMYRQGGLSGAWYPADEITNPAHGYLRLANPEDRNAG